MECLVSVRLLVKQLGCIVNKSISQLPPGLAKTDKLILAKFTDTLIVSSHLILGAHCGEIQL